MPGWRVAMMVSNPEYISWMFKIQSNIENGTFRGIQLAAAEAFNTNTPEWHRENNIENYHRRRVIAEDIMRALGCSFDPTQVGMFLWGKIPDKYENVEKPRLEKEYSFLLEGIQTLIGYKRTHTNDDKYLSKLQMRIEDLAEALENYNLSVEEYVEEHSGWFETVESTKVETPQMVYPAIVKEGQAVLSGKVFIPVKQE